MIETPDLWTELQPHLVTLSLTIGGWVVVGFLVYFAVSFYNTVRLQRATTYDGDDDDYDWDDYWRKQGLK